MTDRTLGIVLKFRKALKESTPEFVRAEKYSEEWFDYLNKNVQLQALDELVEVIEKDLK